MIRKYPHAVASQKEMLEAGEKREKLVEYLDSATTTRWPFLNHGAALVGCIQVALGIGGPGGSVRTKAPFDVARDSPSFLYWESVVVRHVARRRLQPRFEACDEAL